MMTVLQIIPALGTGGAEQACVDMAQGLIERADRAIIVSTGGWRVPQLEAIGAQHITASVATKNPLKIIKNAIWLARLIRKEKIDVVHVRSRAPAWSARMACHWTGCPFVTTFHAAYKFTGDLKKSYNRVMVSSDRVIAISPFILHHIKKHYAIPAEKLRLVNRGIDLDHYAHDRIESSKLEQTRKLWGIDEKQPVVLFPARLSPIKGHAFFVEALSLLKKQGKTLPQILFVGDDQGRDSYVSSLKELIEVEGLGSTIKWIGACGDMPLAYALATLVVQPSQVPEGFGRVPIEAMAMGIPVLASNFGGMRYTIKDGETGWLLDPKDKDAWAAALERALALPQDKRDEMGQKGKRWVVRYFSKTAMVAQTLAIYDELMEAHV